MSTSAYEPMSSITPIRAYRYDGRSSRRVEVTLEFFADARVQVRGDGVDQSYPLSDVSSPARVGSATHVLNFADGSRCEVIDNEAYERVSPLMSTPTRWLRTMESRLRYVVLALVVAVAMVWGFVQYGMPALALTVAQQIPRTALADLGADALKHMDEWVFKPSALSTARQTELREKFDAIAHANAQTQHCRFEFRGGGRMGANAFALPSGAIVFTDEIIALAHDDRELIAVAAHEVGHVAQRHTLRQILQNSMTALFLMLVTGDVSSTSSLAAALPTLLVDMKYSRAFEAEADDYAIAYLRANAIPVHYFGDVLQRLDHGHDGDESWSAYLSSHPATPERIARLRQ